MAYIQVPEGVPGIRSLVMYRPDTGQHLYALAQALLRNESPLSQAERELIATFVSALNDCNFCAGSHAAAARFLFGQEKELVDQVIADYQTAPVSDKLKALLTIAKHVQQDARTVSEELVADARNHGATDRDIHDTVFDCGYLCLFNRYVDGLATLTPDPSAYEAMGERMGTIGYVMPKP
jgi:uncharacterized peroxidase-related enzyme